MVKELMATVGIILFIVFVPGFVEGGSYILALICLIASFLLIRPEIKDFEREEEIRKRRG